MVVQDFHNLLERIIARSLRGVMKLPEAIIGVSEQETIRQLFSFLHKDWTEILGMGDVTAVDSIREQAPLLQSTFDSILQEGSLLPISSFPSVLKPPNPKQASVNNKLLLPIEMPL